MKRYKPIEEYSEEWFKKIHKEAKRSKVEESNAKAIQDYTEFLQKYEWSSLYGGLDLGAAFDELSKLRYGRIDAQGKIIDHRHIISLFKLVTGGFKASGFEVGKGEVYTGSFAVNIANTIAYYRSKLQQGRSDDVAEMRLYLQSKIPQTLYFEDGSSAESELFRRFYDDIAVALDVKIFKDAVDTFLRTGEWVKNGKAAYDLYRYNFYDEEYEREVDGFEHSISSGGINNNNNDYTNTEVIISDEDYTKARNLI